MIDYTYQLKKFSSKINSSPLNKIKPKRAIYFTICKTSNIKTPNIRTIDDNFFRNTIVLHRQQKSPVYLLRMKSLIVDCPYAIYI